MFWLHILAIVILILILSIPVLEYISHKNIMKNQSGVNLKKRMRVMRIIIALGSTIGILILLELWLTIHYLT